MTEPLVTARQLLQQCYGSAELQDHLTGADIRADGITDLLRLSFGISRAYAGYFLPLGVASGRVNTL